jgi:hypothetical protein
MKDFDLEQNLHSQMSSISISTHRKTREIKNCRVSPGYSSQ